MPSRLCSRSGKPLSFELALQQTTLDPLQKTILLERYVRVVSVFEARCLRVEVFFHVMRILVTVGSLVVPALLSIQYVDTGDTPDSNITNPDSFAYRIYWATWIISLLVTTSNGILSVFKVDKKYYFLHTTLEQLRSEGWQFLELSGRYSGFYTPHMKPTHENQFVYFCHTVEKIKMKQVEEEYYKLSDAPNQSNPQQAKPNPTISNGTTPGSTATDKKLEVGSLIPPTPLNNLLEQAQALPPELLRQLASMIGQNSNGAPSPQRNSSSEIEGALSDGATAPEMPVSTNVQTSSVAEKGNL
jgi:hypothetical protein